MTAKLIVSLKAPYIDPVSGDEVKLIGGKADIDDQKVLTFVTVFGDLKVHLGNIAAVLAIPNQTTVDPETVKKVRFVNDINEPDVE